MKTLLKHFTALFFLYAVSYQIIAQENDDLYYTPSSHKKDTITKSPEMCHAHVLFDPTGFITFGPAVFIEPAISKNISIPVGIRFHNAGIIQNSLFGRMDMSYMMHLSARYYTKPKQKIDGFFIGPGIEYGRSNYKSGNKYKARALGGELGYKWVFKNGFCFELADMIGLTQSEKIENTSGISVEEDWSTDMFVFYMVSLKIGFMF